MKGQLVVTKDFMDHMLKQGIEDLKFKLPDDDGMIRLLADKMEIIMQPNKVFMIKYYNGDLCIAEHSVELYTLLDIITITGLPLAIGMKI